MRIEFGGKGLQSWTEGAEAESTGRQADVILFSFFEEAVSYEKELKGETGFFESIAKFSKSRQCVVVCGCITDTHGQRRKSAVVAERGRLIGVSDMLHALDDGYSAGAALRVYETGIGKMGVVVSQDLYFPEVIKGLVLCGSDFLVCPFEKSGEIESVLLRANAYCYGAPIFFCSDRIAMIAEPSGKIAFSSPQIPTGIDFSFFKEYHLVETRKRGCGKVR